MTAPDNDCPHDHCDVDEATGYWQCLDCDAEGLDPKFEDGE